MAVYYGVEILKTIERFYNFLCVIRGRSMISGKGVHMYKGVGVRFADLISFFPKYPMKMK